MSEQCPKCKSTDTYCDNSDTRKAGAALGFGLPVAGLLLGGPIGAAIGGAVGSYVAKAGRYQFFHKECVCRNCHHRWTVSIK